MEVPTITEWETTAKQAVVQLNQWVKAYENLEKLHRDATEMLEEVIKMLRDHRCNSL